MIYPVYFIAYFAYLLLSVKLIDVLNPPDVAAAIINNLNRYYIVFTIIDLGMAAFMLYRIYKENTVAEVSASNKTKTR